MNNKGFTMFDVVVSIFIIGLVMAVVSPVLFTVKNTMKSNQNESIYIQTIYNTMANVREIEDWKTIENQTIPLHDEYMEILYYYMGETEYETEKLKTTFKKGRITKDYYLERSIYYGL